MIRLGICNELFDGWDFARVCHTVRELGYDGLEIAPFTLAPLATDLSPSDRARLRRTMETADLACIGLHWLLAKTDGFYLTSPDINVRMRTANYLIELARLCHDLGGHVLVLGSPKQRDLQQGVSYSQAIAYAREVLATAMPTVGSLDVELCLEPLAPSETNFLNTIPQALELIRQVDHPAFKLHLDVKAQSSDPTGSLTELIARHGAEAGHFHAQDPNLRGPGMGDLEFGPILRSLVASGYDRWVSVEVFDFSPGPEKTAVESIACLHRELDKAQRGLR